MCLLTFIPAGIEVNTVDLRNGADYNPDGFGFAIHCGDHIITGKGMDFETVLEQFVDARSRNKGCALFHSRITTHGNTNVENCHPFRVGGDTLTVLGHNGVLPIKVEKSDPRSDTNIFASEYLPNIGGVYALDDPKVFADLEKWSKGSKMVVLTADRHANKDYYILNEKDGHWSEGVWWSNASYTYEPAVSPYVGGWNAYISKHTKYGQYTYDYVAVPSDDDWYGDIYMVECPICSHPEVYDLGTDDVHGCKWCDSCMYCAKDIKFCVCDEVTEWSYEPTYEKMTPREIEEWLQYSYDYEREDSNGTSKM